MHFVLVIWQVSLLRLFPSQQPSTDGKDTHAFVSARQDACLTWDLRAIGRQFLLTNEILARLRVKKGVSYRIADADLRSIY